MLAIDILKPTDDAVQILIITLHCIIVVQLSPYSLGLAFMCVSVSVCIYLA